MSIYRRAMGSEFEQLHPMIQERFGFDSETCVASIGQGIMDKVWHGPFWTLPFLYLGAWRNIMFPEAGTNVPFRILNYAYQDRYGRETVTWIREFELRKRRVFAATMIYSEKRNRIVDYLGTHQHLAVDLELSVSQRRGMSIRSGEQRFYEGPIAFRFPLAFSGIAEVEEWYDDAASCFRIEVSVRNRIWGRLFGYNGRFTAANQKCSVYDIPDWIRPLREERRE